MEPIGNAWLAEKFNLGPVDLSRRSYIGSQSSLRAEPGYEEKVYPKVYAVGSDPLDHVSFALKHESPRLEILREVFRNLEGAKVAAYVAQKPAGQYTRQIGFLYEFLTAQKLFSGVPPMVGSYVPVLHPARFVTSSPRSDSRWRVYDNLLGTPAFCPTVRLTKEVKAAIQRPWTEQVDRVLEGASPDVVKRALGYLYSKETRSSFLIERDEAGPDRTNRFIGVLKMAGREVSKQALDEKRLVALQQVIVDPRYAQDSFRTNQNYVGETMPGLREHVHYVCPPPQFVRSLMGGLADSAQRMDTAPAVVQAAVTAFQFVFVHPFEDGNGRIHRFLLHDVLTRREVLKNGALLPISAVMLEDMKSYDAALERFSKPVVSRCSYELSDDGKLTLHNPDEMEPFWRYPDLTHQVTYLGSVMGEAIKALPEELRFIERYDHAREAIQAVVDMPDKKMRLFMNILHSNGGRLSKSKRSLFAELSADEIQRMEKAYVDAFRNDVHEESQVRSRQRRRI